MSKEEERGDFGRGDRNLSSRKDGGNSQSKKIRVTEYLLGFNENSEGSTSNVGERIRVSENPLGFNENPEGSTSNEVQRIMASQNSLGFNENPEGSTSNEGEMIGSSDVVEPQDADYSYNPSLSDELVHHILARVPRSEYWKLSFVNKGCLALLRSGELYKLRKDYGTMEPSVFMLASGEPQWWSLDQKFTSCRKLPVLPADSCFAAGDKESLCAGTHLLVSGKEIEGVVIWRYELSMNRWYKGPSMINPRCLFASASCGDVAYVAGGIGMGNIMQVLNSAELYNSETKSWEPLPKMHTPRKLCSGCYMDNKFYVIGGQGIDGGDLTCGECFDARKNTWELIPGMMRDVPIPVSRSPPLLAVVNNELYTLDASSNKLKVYLKRSNCWKELGQVPVRADHSRGWGVAFKSLGKELLVIGGTCNSFAGHGMIICTCSPDPEANDLEWKHVGTGRNRLSHFILNCSVMRA
ncbi:F-box domain [Macleaya cordata]|uniref:F-box domain n=1 Tax=Macleaya cordata TaxID=56857 RepID=A0A200QGE4_MACCD|nr:F-box domain [Macleaya cordata]